MTKALLAAAMVLAGSAALAADSVKVTVGHMCCGACKGSATAGAKNAAWVDSVAIDGTTVTVTAKEGQKVDIVTLMDAMQKSGFPAREISASGPVTLTLAHLCCGGCVNDLKTKVGELRSQTLDKGNVKIDQASKTITLQPAAGQKLNVAAIVRQLATAGFAPSSGTIVAASGPTPRRAAASR